MIITKKQERLINKRKNSSQSKCEVIISKFLIDNRIHFYTEFYFKEFSRSGKLKLLFFDFYIPSYKTCIEFDGMQHYTLKFKGKKLNNQRENDFLKNAFCKKKGINLLRIKYTDADKIEGIICDFFDNKFPI